MSTPTVLSLHVSAITAILFTKASVARAEHEEAVKSGAPKRVQSDYAGIANHTRKLALAALADDTFTVAEGK